tara:strand:- start:260 stop:856 length:597 start_codon:yes stop_codon:yes gene_type:complete
MSAFQIYTDRGYALLDVASVLQKSIRRADAKLAGYFALELFHSGYQNYMWKRLLTISAEDCHELMTTEIWNLKQSFDFINKGVKKGDQPKGRIFISKAVISLANCYKNRDADHLQNLVYDKIIFDADDLQEYVKICELADDELAEICASLEDVVIPDYAYDVHTRKGRKKGMTKGDFFKDEQLALKPKQDGLFDNLVE